MGHIHFAITKDTDLPIHFFLSLAVQGLSLCGQQLLQRDDALPV